MKTQDKFVPILLLLIFAAVIAIPFYDMLTIKSDYETMLKGESVKAKIGQDVYDAMKVSAHASYSRSECITFTEGELFCPKKEIIAPPVVDVVEQ